MVERNVGNAVKRGTVVPPGSRATHQRAGSGVLFFGIDRDDRSFGIAVEQRDKALRLFPGVAEEAGSNLVVGGARRCAKRGQQGQK